MSPHDASRQPSPPPSRPPADQSPSGSMNRSNPPHAPPYPPISGTVVQRAGGGIVTASPSRPYAQYPPQRPSIPKDDHRPYLTQSSQSEYYPPPHSQGHSYAYAQSDLMRPEFQSSSAHQQKQTPSEIYNNYSPTAQLNSSQRGPGIDPYYHMPLSPQHVVSLPGGNSSHSGPLSSTQSQPSNPPEERFPCDLCDQTFSRAHDRLKHNAAVHHPALALHRCRDCRKEFSRVDALRRHIEKGCDEMSFHR